MLHFPEEQWLCVHKFIGFPEPTLVTNETQLCTGVLGQPSLFFHREGPLLTCSHGPAMLYGWGDSPGHPPLGQRSHQSEEGTMRREGGRPAGCSFLCTAWMCQPQSGQESNVERGVGPNPGCAAQCVICPLSLASTSVRWG